jgi:hypothetical protein
VYDTPLMGTPENIRVHGEIATAAFRLLPDPQATVYGHVEKLGSLHALISSDRGYVTPVREVHRNALNFLCCLPQPPRTRIGLSQLLAAASGTDDTVARIHAYAQCRTQHVDHGVQLPRHRQPAVKWRLRQRR